LGHDLVAFCDLGNLVSLNFLQYRAGSPEVRQWRSKSQTAEKEILVVKTFIVYDLDTGLPIAVGEAIKAEWARVETAEETDIRAENLIAEEISLGEEFELP
jgi:hypothetical protein